MKHFFLIFQFCVGAFFGFQEIKAQSPCFPGRPTTAAYATGGESPYIGDVLWLTWGTPIDSLEKYPYGKHNEPLENGASSYASIPLGNNRHLCIEATISNLQGKISSYRPGNYQYDYIDDLYNIDGTDHDNRLISGIKNQEDGGEPSFTISCKASLDGRPVRLAGLVLGDAESLDKNGEYFEVIADGKWTIVELRKNLNEEDPYEILKTDTNDNGVIKQKIRFNKGNDRNTSAVSFLTFDQTAYSSYTGGYEVSFDVTLKGTGTTAIALGLLTINADGGDAPESYGTPLHLFEAMTLTDDGIPVDGPVNLNVKDYKPGSLESIPSTYLGTTGPDHDAAPLYSKDARGDDDEPTPSDEEEAWPEEYKRFSYKATYMPGDIIRAEIPYRGTTSGYIAGWIDFNLNGKFDEDELTIKSVPVRPSGGTVTLEWTVPLNRVPYSTYVRLRYGPNEDEVSSPISVATGGEVEDHRIYIFGPAITNPMLPSKAKRSQN